MNPNQRQRHPYKKLNHNVQKLLTNQLYAEQVIMAWLFSEKLRPTSYLSKHEVEDGCQYVKGSLLSFTKLGVESFVSMQNILFWTGEERQTIYTRFNRNRSYFEEFGVEYLDSKSQDLRLAMAYKLGLYRYVTMTSRLTLFKPCCVALFLLTGKSDKCISFRTFVKDFGPDKSYNTAKLYVTFEKMETKTNANTTT